MDSIKDAWHEGEPNNWNEEHCACLHSSLIDIACDRRMSGSCSFVKPICEFVI